MRPEFFARVPAPVLSLPRLLPFFQGFSKVLAELIHLPDKLCPSANGGGGHKRIVFRLRAHAEIEGDAVFFPVVVG